MFWNWKRKCISFNENNEQKILNKNNTCNFWYWYNLPINLFDDQYIVYLGSWIIPIRICNPRNAFISSIVVSTHPWSTLWAAYKLVLSTIICTKARGNITMKNCKGFASKGSWYVGPEDSTNSGTSMSSTTSLQKSASLMSLAWLSRSNNVD